MKSNFGQLILIELISSKKYPISIIEIGDGKNSIESAINFVRVRYDIFLGKRIH